MLALLFSVVFVVPTVLTYADRSLPFEYVHVYSKPQALHAGQVGTIVFVVTDVKETTTAGEVSRYFTDAKGNRFFLGTSSTSYRQGLKETNERTFKKDWRVPLDAAPGPGLYEAEVLFWHNFVQGDLSPIRAPPIKVPVTIMPPEPTKGE